MDVLREQCAFIFSVKQSKKMHYHNMKQQYRQVSFYTMDISLKKVTQTEIVQTEHRILI